MARCPFVMLSVLLSICLSAQLNPVWSEEVQGGRRSVADIHIVNSFLSYVEIIQRNKDNCAPGVTFDLGERVVAQFGDEEFKQQAMLAVNRANFLTRIWKGSSQVLLDSEYFFYTQVRSMVEGDPDIFAAINCYDSMEYPDYRLFCPYAYRLPNDSSEIMVKDLAMEYKYDGSDAEFFSVPKVNARYKLSQVYKETIGYAMYPFNNTHHHPVVQEDSIKIVYSDGHWTKPFFDCKGGDIWMMTYTVPFFGYRPENDSYYFKGTSGVDVDLQKVDIDQCPLPEGSKTINVFAGTDKCKAETTKCVAVKGMGFRRGSYKCQCKDGFYFPDNTLPESSRFFNGSDIEINYETKMKGEANNYDMSYNCLPCAPGCETCTDGTSCAQTGMH